MRYFWVKRNFLAYLLWPLSLFYRSIVFLREKLYQNHFLKKNHFPIPIIVVGNITVGGSGKTPLVIELACFLKKQGWLPGIISRGYGAKAKRFPFHVHSYSYVREVGDEPLLIVRHTACPTVIDPNRSRAIKSLLKRSNCNIVISDDGLQHLKLARTIEIAVIDGQHRFGNGFYLPAGPLREPISRLQSVDFVVRKGEKEATLTQEFKFALVPDFFYQLIQPEVKKNLAHFQEKTVVHAVAGIGNPGQFFSCLRTLGLKVIEHPFPDHYYFKPNDFNYGSDAIILMTEKDAVKCVGFSDARLWCLKSKTEVDPALLKALLTRLTELGNNPKSFSSSFQ